MGSTLPPTIPSVILANSRGARMAAIGDSTTIADGYTPLSGAPSAQGNNWPTYLSLASGGLISILRNFGVGGTTSLQALNTQLPQVLATNPLPDFCLIGTGTNDTDPVNQTQPNVTAICQRLIAAGIRPIIRSMPPAGMQAISAPNNVVVTTSTTGGTLQAGTYSYRVAVTTPNGKSLPGPEVMVNTTGSTSANTITWQSVPSGGGYEVYGRTSGAELLIGVINNTGGQSRPLCSFTDTGSVTPSGAMPVTNTTGSSLSSTVRTKIVTGNAILNRIAQKLGIPFLDMYNFFVDPATGTYQLGTTIEGTHPCSQSMKLFGQNAWASLQNFFPPFVPYLCGDNADPTQLFGNPLYLNNNGNYPTGWAPFSGSAAESMVTVSGIRGQTYRTAIPGYAARFSTWQINSGFSVGDTIQVSGKMQLSGADQNGGQGLFQLYAVGPNAAIGGYVLNSDTGGVVTFQFEGTVPAGTTALQLKKNVSYGPCTFDIGEINVRNLTALGITP
ncbi:SGNH/GDSL hydrolase family protein [Burkholderia stagnalis]|uniref:SGNH/GDSL hydrolase family protein n=1 Tax=Burkholderia stagnalis TaxID=1503054 RepID=UPI000F572834|nr:SGNH/GDSL hydrolase family protein [Burkholderia stagnalis]RQR03196.1 hypothetical protein DF025_32565 [Burkholderia stagnalis]RQR12389.1 hypothetical protein DF026_32690 [Burkholderia stagnalis]